jgi:hypothetical protein
MQLDGGTVSAILIGAATLLTFLVSQTSTKAREQRRRLKALAKRDIAAAGWIHAVQVWAARHGYDDLPKVPAVLSEDDAEDGDS